MSQWFPTLDEAIGGTADAIGSGTGWVLSGVGETIGGAVEGTGDVVGDTTGSLLAGAFGGLGRWLLMASIVIGAVIVIPKVV